MILDVNELNRLESERLLNSQTHPQFPNLRIYKYSAECQNSRAWTQLLRICRGIVVDTETGEVVMRGFDKFFNLSELESIGDTLPVGEDYEVFEKLDGSLITATEWRGNRIIASSGSFQSEQALKATEMLISKSLPKDGWTAIFEIIYPQNRIVIDYGQREELVLIGYRHVDGQEKSIHEIPAPFNKPKKVSLTISDLVEIQDTAFTNEEGFVVRFESGYRVKVKYSDYVKLHRVVTGLTEWAIWNELATKGNLKDFQIGLPEEFEKWMNDVWKRIIHDFDAIEFECDYWFKNVKEQLPKDHDRKSFALLAKQTPYPSIMFLMLDGKETKQAIFKLIEP